MKSIYTLIFTSVLLSSSLLGQTVFWQDNFEGTTPEMAAGSTRTPGNNSGSGGPPFTSYFCRTPAVSTVSQSVAFTGFLNTNYWAGEDHDTPFGLGNEEQQIEWTGINISGKNSLSFQGLLAANHTNGPWDNGSASGGSDPMGPTNLNDYIIVEYAIDAGAYTQLYLFIGDNDGIAPPFKTLREDTNADGKGDGTQLQNVFAQFTKAIPSTGTTMKLRIRARANGTNEEWGIDNFRLTAVALPVTWSHFYVTEAPQSVDLTWGTATESGSDYFAVERSLDGNTFAEIGRVTANGNTTTASEYTFSDQNPVLGRSFYRIKQVDVNGDFMQSEAREAYYTQPEEFTAYPSPAHDWLSIIHAKGAKAIQIFGLAGDAVPATVHLGSDIAAVDVSQLAAGIYIARIERESGFVMRRFAVQH